MPSWLEGDLTANDVRLHYQRAGAGRPALLFAHGLTDSGRCWLPVAEPLAAEHEIVLYDARGHGLSEAPEQGYTFDLLADDLVGLISGLGLDRPVVIGHSMGAATAALAAARHPGLARAIVLEDPASPTRFEDEEGAARAAQWRADLIADKARSRDELIAKGRAQSPLWSEAELGPWAEAKQQASPNTLDIVRAPGSPWYELVEQVDCPILLITGDPAAGAIVSPEFSGALARRWRNGQVAHIAGAGHCIRRDAYAAFMDALRSFLREVAA